MTDDADSLCGAECLDGTPCERIPAAGRDLCRFHDPDLPRKVTTPQMARALAETRGNITQAANLLGCHLRTIRKRCDKNEELQEVVDTVKDEHIDRVVAGLEERALTEQRASEYYLNANAKDRGYGKEVKVNQISEDGSMSPGGATIDPSKLDDDELDRLLELCEKGKADDDDDDGE